MSMVHRFFLLFFAVALTLCFMNKAQACVFIGGTEPPCSAYWKADAVFTGVVQEIFLIKRESGEIYDQLLIRFTVLQSHRGISDEHIEVTTISGTECDTKFQVGEKWLVYGHRNPQSGKLVVSSRTSHYEHAAEDLAYIRSVAQGAMESAIYGGVYQDHSIPWEGIRIEIDGAGQKYQVVTDKDGKFRVFNVKPGRYVIRGLFPAGTFPFWMGDSDFRRPSNSKGDNKGTVVEFNVEILTGRCGYIEFLVMKPR